MWFTTNIMNLMDFWTDREVLWKSWLDVLPEFFKKKMILEGYIFQNDKEHKVYIQHIVFKQFTTLCSKIRWGKGRKVYGIQGGGG